MLGHQGVRWTIVWWVERIIIGIIGIRVVTTNGVSVRGTGGLRSLWFLRFLRNSVRFLFRRQWMCRWWEINGSLGVKLAEVVAGTVRLFGNHRPGGSCGGGR